MSKRPVYMPLPMKVDKIEQHTSFHFRCDDRDGFLLSILWASDGDLHLSIQADPDHENYESNCNRISGSVRLRLPMIGGGCFEHLMPALIAGLRKERISYDAYIKKHQTKDKAP